jgi:hypothetical protein
MNGSSNLQIYKKSKQAKSKRFNPKGALIMKLADRIASNEFSVPVQPNSDSKENCDLELVPAERSDRFINARAYSILAQIENFCKTAIAILTQEPEVEIRQKQDRNGHIRWSVYDPQVGKSISFASELEMLSWLDNQNGRW